jgi:hypothetical protein
MRRLARGSVHLPHTPPPESRVTDGIKFHVPVRVDSVIPTRAAGHAICCQRGAQCVKFVVIYTVYTAPTSTLGFDARFPSSSHASQLLSKPPMTSERSIECLGTAYCQTTIRMRCR